MANKPAPVPDAEAEKMQEELEWLLSQEREAKLPGIVDNFTLRLLADRTRDKETIAALTPIVSTTVIAKCYDCGKDWPHPSVLSSSPLCESCGTLREHRYQERIVELEAVLKVALGIIERDVWVLNEDRVKLEQLPGYKAARALLGEVPDGE